MYSKFLNKNTPSLAIFWYFYKPMLLLIHSSDQIVPLPLKKYLILSNQRFKWSIDFSYFNVLKFCNFPFSPFWNWFKSHPPCFPILPIRFCSVSNFFVLFRLPCPCSWLLSECSESPRTILFSQFHDKNG